jgi:hypothetical protein
MLPPPPVLKRQVAKDVKPLKPKKAPMMKKPVSLSTSIHQFVHGPVIPFICAGGALILSIMFLLSYPTSDVMTPLLSFCAGIFAPGIVAKLGSWIRKRMRNSRAWRRSPFSRFLLRIVQFTAGLTRL